MTPIQTKIIDVVNAKGGKATWQEVMDALEYQERRLALNEIRPLEKQKLILRVVSRNAVTGATVFTVNKVGE